MSARGNLKQLFRDATCLCKMSSWPSASMLLSVYAGTGDARWHETGVRQRPQSAAHAEWCFRGHG